MNAVQGALTLLHALEEMMGPTFKLACEAALLKASLTALDVAPANSHLWFDFAWPFSV